MDKQAITSLLLRTNLSNLCKRVKSTISHRWWPSLSSWTPFLLLTMQQLHSAWPWKWWSPVDNVKLLPAWQIHSCSVWLPTVLVLSVVDCKRGVVGTKSWNHRRTITRYELCFGATLASQTPVPTRKPWKPPIIALTPQNRKASCRKKLEVKMTSRTRTHYAMDQKSREAGTMRTEGRVVWNSFARPYYLLNSCCSVHYRAIAVCFEGWAV